MHMHRTRYAGVTLIFWRISPAARAFVCHPSQKLIARLRRLLQTGGRVAAKQLAAEAASSPAATTSSAQAETSTFASRANNMNSRGVETMIDKLGVFGSDLEKEKAWTTNDTIGGGLHEFRAAVFDKKLETMSKRCEEAHEEAEAVSDAYLLLLEATR